MGLDVYLHKCANFEATRAAENAAEAEKTARWEAAGDYDQLSAEQRTAISAQCDAIDQKYGLTGEYGRHADIESIERPSALYPQHLFKVGYFRSSYNGGGINNVLERLGVPNLYDIVQPQEDDYYVRCDWAQALQRVDAAIAQFKATQEGPTAGIDVMPIRFNHFIPMGELPKSEREVLAIMAKHLAREHRGGGYGCREGDFFPEGLKIVAAIPGVDDTLGTQPCVYLAYEKASKGEDDWYLQALRIVKETFEYVLAQPNPEHFYLTWSS